MWDGLNIGQFFCELNTSYIIGYFDQTELTVLQR